MMKLLVLLCIITLACAHTPEQWRNRTIFQVLTDRFNNPNGGQCDLSTYCGGTFKGIQDKLDYIAGMGFDAIWISPIVINTPGGYHGYWAKDIAVDAINPHFGTASDLKNLVDACHLRDMWVMVDVVANHMGPADPSTFSPFNSWEYFHNCNGCPSSCNIENFQNLPQVQHCRLAGLPDLNQSMPFVANTLNSWIAGIVQTYGFDGLRVDTVPEVNKPFWKSFNKAAGVYAVGEVYDGRVDYVASFQGAALDATLSYPLFFTLRSVFTQQQSMFQIQNQLQAYKAFPDTTILGTFIDNHDQPRFLHQNGDYSLYKAAIAYVLLGEGIPIIYYGTEQGFNGGNDPNNREALWPSNFNTNAQLYQYIQMLVSFRKRKQVWSGPQVQRYADDNFYAFSRGDVFVALTNVGNNGNEIKRTITYQPYSDGTTICNLFYPKTDCITIKNGKFNVYLLHGETKVYFPVS